MPYNTIGLRTKGDGRYNVVGRYMNGPEVAGYHLVREGGGQARVGREQLIFMLGRGEINNCTVQLYRGEILIRGKGININELPVMDDKTNQIRGEESNGGRRKQIRNALGKFEVVSRIMAGTRIIGYGVRDNSGGEHSLPREKVEELAMAGLLSNARAQRYQGNILLRGVGIQLSKLPTIKSQ